MTGFLSAQPLPTLVEPTRPARAAQVEPSDPTPLAWARRRRSEREARQAGFTRERTTARLARLGGGWRVLDIQEIGLLNSNTFLAIGPGGVFVVSVKQHGRGRVRIAGDVVQVDGRRPGYIAEAMQVAEQASRALSRTAGQTIPVTPVVAFAGSGVIDVHGLPKGCLVTPHRELDYLLGSYGARIGQATVAKLYAIAKHPVTWIRPTPQQDVDAYTWYTGRAAVGKKAAGA
ncbi:MAG: NERD domain-containing protein [Micromonosporaceae bacterium]|nr:NERD domain-containing protein [Micromonosporaceae bacterium]